MINHKTNQLSGSFEIRNDTDQRRAEILKKAFRRLRFAGKLMATLDVAIGATAVAVKFDVHDVKFAIGCAGASVFFIGTTKIAKHGGAIVTKELERYESLKPFRRY